MPQTTITVNTIYRQGVLYPLTLLPLPEETSVSVDITLPDAQATSASDFAALQGIWAGLGDPTYEEIETIAHKAAEMRWHSLLSSLAGNTE